MNVQDTALRAAIIRALRSVDLPAGISTRLSYGPLADAVMAIGQFDVVLNSSGVHLYHSTHCRHGHLELCVDDRDGRRPAQCKACGAPCWHTYEDSEGNPPA